MSQETPRRKVVIDSDGKSAHTISPVDIEMEETDIM